MTDSEVKFTDFEWVFEKLMHNPPAADHEALLPAHWIKTRSPLTDSSILPQYRGQRSKMSGFVEPALRMDARGSSHRWVRMPLSTAVLRRSKTCSKSPVPSISSTSRCLR